MTVQNTMQTMALIILSGGVFAFLMLQLSTTLFYLKTHSFGTFIYVAKSLAIVLLTIPVTILVLCVPFFYLLKKLIPPIWRRIKRKKANIMVPDEVITENPDAVVHLIHGTFENDAPWTLNGSALRDEFTSLGLKVGISHFSWGGKNAAAARSLAAQALATKIAGSPAKHHYLIAHSHGGAIVREMSHLRQDIAHKICGVSLLSTPFIFRRERDRSSGSFFHLTDISGTFSFQLMLFGLFYSLGLYNFYVFLLSMMLSLLLEFKISSRLKGTLKEEVKRDLKRESIKFNNVQIYHAIGDEADSGLRFISSLHEGCFAVLAQLKTASLSISKHLHFTTKASYLGFVLILGYLWLFVPNSEDWRFTCVVGIFTVALVDWWKRRNQADELPFLLVTAAFPVVICSFWLGVAKALAYGDLRLIFCPEIFISSSETPAGKFPVTKIAPPDDDSALIHSTHSHPEVIKNVAIWLKESEEGRISQGPVD